jgi:putative phage-type endonuclease
MRLLNVEQGSFEWRRARRGVPTASRAADVVARLKPLKGEEVGRPAQVRKDYALQLAFERVTLMEWPVYVNAAMQRGTDLEPLARDEYEARSGTMVEQVGIALHDELDVGASPDGLVGDEGLIEIKCPYEMGRVARVWATGDVSDYEAQVQWQLWVLQRSWCDVVVYDPRLEDVAMHLFVKRIHADPETFALFEREVPEFLNEVAALEAQLTAEKEKQSE